MKENKSKPIFKNEQDPNHVLPLPEVLPKVEPIQSTDDEKTIALKSINITEDDILFVKNCKEQFSLTSDRTERLWHIHLQILQKFPYGDKYCGACVQSCLNAIWEKCEPIYGKYYTKTIS